MATPQPTTGSKFARDKLGIRTIQLVFIVNGPTDDGGDEPWDELDGFDPEPPMGLVAVDRAAEKQEDGSWHLTITFEGITGDDVKGAVLEYDNSGVDDPIETFEKFQALLVEYKSTQQFDEDTGKFKGFKRMIPPKGSPDIGPSKTVQSPLYGTSHFLNNNPILRVSFATKEFKQEFHKNICKIDTPQVPEGTAKVVDTPEGKSWLKRKVTGTFRGNVWQVTFEYALGKWVPDIYNPT